MFAAKSMIFPWLEHIFQLNVKYVKFTENRDILSEI